MKSLIMYVVCTLAFSTTTLAQSRNDEVKGREVGGGSAVETLDGDILLSDRLYKHPGVPKRYSDFPEKVKKYIDEVEYFLRRLGLINPKFFDETVRGSQAIYIFLAPGEEKKIKCEDGKYLPDLITPVKRHFGIGCRGPGNVTYMWDAHREFEKNKKEELKVREFAMAILHERLWVAHPKVLQMFIAHFTTITGDLMERRDNQIFRNDRKPLTDDDLAKYDLLEMAAEQLGFQRSYIGYRILRFPLSKNIYKNGGGIILNENCNDTRCTKNEAPLEHKIEKSFIGVGSLVSALSTVKNSDILNCNVWGSKTNLENVSIINSIIASNGGVDLKNSTVSGSSLSNVKGSFTNITTSAIHTATIEGQPDAFTTIANSTIENTYAKIYEGVTIKASKLNGYGYNYKYYLEIHRGANLDNLEVESVYDSRVVFTEGARVSNLKYWNKYDPFFGTTETIFYPSENLNFNNLKCTVEQRRVNIGSVNDLLPLCEQKSN